MSNRILQQSDIVKQFNTMFENYLTLNVAEVQDISNIRLSRALDQVRDLFEHWHCYSAVDNHFAVEVHAILRAAGVAHQIVINDTVHMYRWPARLVNC